MRTWTMSSTGTLSIDAAASRPWPIAQGDPLLYSPVNNGSWHPGAKRELFIGRICDKGRNSGIRVSLTY